MPLFLSEEDFRLCSHDPSLVAERADQFIRDLHRQLETVRAESDAASIAAEQTCVLLEQRFSSLSSDFSKLQSDNSQLSASVEQKLSELAQTLAEKHQLHLKAIEKDGEMERLMVEASELHKSKRQLLELIGQKDIEIGEKNATIQSYLDKIVNLTQHATSKEARFHETEAELARCHATCTQLSQEKELFEKHNGWLNEELTVKVNSLIDLRKMHMDFEADMSAKLADVERKYSESSRSLKHREERVRDLEMKLASTEEELRLCKESADSDEERFTAELSTVTRLVDLYKESSDAWSKKSGELGGVIKALETHLSQVENDYKEKLEKELSARKDLEKEAAGLKEKLERCEVELESTRKANDLSLIPISNFQSDTTVGEMFDCSISQWAGHIDNQNENCHMLVPKVPAGISGTALAASLLRDGWSLAKMYEKYQEAADALRHERWGRKQSEDVLERVLHEIEVKAEFILDERAEHEKMMEAYSLMNEKLQQALLERDNLESTILRLKAEVKRHERDYSFAQKEITDLQKQVTVLLKECRDVQLRCGVDNQYYPDDSIIATSSEFDVGSDDDRIVSEHLLTFREINELVEQNVKLRSFVRRLSSEEEKRDVELRDSFQVELQKCANEAAAKVEAVFKRSEEQKCLIESLHSSVAMYRKLYEEERKVHACSPHPIESASEDGKDLILLFEGSQDVAKKAHEQLAERARSLEEDLSRLRDEVMSLRSQRDKMAMEAKSASEKFDNAMKDLERQRDEVNGVSARNVELTQLLIDYQRRLRESSDSLHDSEEHLRKLSVEVSVLKHEREILISSEKRASDEVRNLSERVHRLQSSLDTVQSVEMIREETKTAERKRLQDDINRVEREWAEAKKELQDARDHIHTITVDRDNIVENSMRQVEEMGKKLADAWHAVSSAESRAAVAEARCSHLESTINGNAKKKVAQKGGAHDNDFSTNANVGTGDMCKMTEDFENLKEEARAYKDYMLQYKEIAHTNEVALKQIESVHEEFKAEADKMKAALDADVLSLRQRVSELEKNSILKSSEASAAVAEKDEALASAMVEVARLKEETSIKTTQMVDMEIQISSLKENLENEHLRWRSAQDKYERQVILQSETIQELTKTSQELSSFQGEVSELRKLLDAQKAQNEFLRTSWETEKSVLEESKNEAEKNYNEVNEQNKILHKHLEALHDKLLDNECSAAGIGSQSSASDPGESELQTVISYLRRSKELAVTEVTLLKHEKLRLQSQLENALKASETAQALLHSDRENARAVLYTDEEFKSLQHQVREINLLRESNIQLRYENKHNFEEYQKFREIAQKTKLETEKNDILLREKEIEVEAYQREIEMWKLEREQLENRMNELLENIKNIKNIDVAEHERMKEEVQQTQVILKERESEVELMKRLVSEKQEIILHLQQELERSQQEIAEWEKKANDSLLIEATLKSEIEKQKKFMTLLKKKNDNLSKEKEELSKENQILIKQIEDSRSGKRAVGEGPSEQALKEKEKEKDTRIQMLEKTLEREREELRREREDNRREKLKRQKTERTALDYNQMVNQEKKKLIEEIGKMKHGIANVLESFGITAAQLPSQSGLDEQTICYFLAVDNFEEAVTSVLNDGVGTRPVSADTALPDSSLATAGQQVPAELMRSASPQSKAEHIEKRSILPKTTIDARKIVRKLVRPRLERSEEPSVDIEMAETEVSTMLDEVKVTESHVQESHANLALSAQISSRKRFATSSASEFREEFSVPHEGSSEAPLPKKYKGSESPQEGTEGLANQHSESLTTIPSMKDKDVIEVVHAHDSSNVTAGSAKDQELDATAKEPVQEEQKEPLAEFIQEDELKNECDAITEEFQDKPRELTEMFDEFPKGGEDLDEQQFAMEEEEEREEGELLPDEQEEQKLEGAESEEGHNEPNSADAVVVETVDGLEIAASPEDLNGEKKDTVDVFEEELVEGLDKSNNNNDQQSSLESELSPPQVSLVLREGSPNPAGDTTVAEQGNPGVVAEAGDSQRRAKGSSSSSSSTLVDISERAKQNAEKRKLGIVSTLLPARGRGRAAGGLRRESARGGTRATRGGRGGRGGRGQASGDREQG